ncbi:MAG TPA: di-heme oxidoredictase family protein [Myxococcales bacterium]|nr:di-heme oxidoredictase family protein [Myxococcales bacterium]
MHARTLAFAIGVVLVCGCGAKSPDQLDAQENATEDVSEALVRAHTALGDPLPGLTKDELAAFNDGKESFQEVEGNADGLGPVFNENSCAACHTGPTGGSNGRLETRFGRKNPDGSFDPLAALGGSLLQDHGIGDVPGHSYPAEVVPAIANVVARRRTTALFGLGLVDATPDATFRALAARQARFTPEAAGKVAIVDNLVTGTKGVGKFGWKNGNPTLLQFSADAYLNEMGITSPIFPDENCPQGDCAALAFNPRPDLNDADGADVQEFADFMTFLAPPLRGPLSLKSLIGEGVFTAIGCAVCHVPTLVTGRNAVRALDRVAYHPFSDFLLHDMGSLGDGIVQGAAGAREMRTAPLWGLRHATVLLHDGRAKTVRDAVLAHDGQGLRSRNRFANLDSRSRDALLAFLASL